MPRREQVLVACTDRAVLERLGNEIVKDKRKPLLTRDPEAALRLAIESRPDVAVIDADMGDVDGHLLVWRLRRIPTLRDTPIVLVARDTGPRHVELAMNAGATDYVPGPVDGAEVAARLRRYLEPVAT